jgi:hypothetical protein
LPNENILPTTGISAKSSEEIFPYRTGFVTKFGPQICLLPVPIFGVKINHIQESCGKGVVNTPTIIYDDNAACVAQMHMGYVKSNLTKHIAPKFFYPTSSRRAGKLRSCKQDHVAILQIYSQNLYWPPAYINAFMELE